MQPLLGHYTSATLPLASTCPAGTVATTTEGPRMSDGTKWLPSVITTKTANKLRNLIVQAQIANAATAQPLIAPSNWLTGTVYTKGQSVINGGNVYTCIVGGTSAAAPTLTTNGAIVDGTVTWYYMGPSFASNANAPTLTNVLSGSAYTGNFYTNTANTRTDGSAQIRDSSLFRVTGTAVTENASPNNGMVGSNNAILMSVSFMTDAPQFQIVANGGSTPNAQIYVNGVPLTLGYGTTVVQSQSVYYWQVVFPATANGARQQRLITFEIVAASSPLYFNGVLMNDTTSKVWAPSLPNSVRTAIIGTSYIAGSAVHPVTQSLGWGALTAKLLGITDYYQDSLGAGTGYVAGGTAGNFSAPTRYNALIAYAPDLVIIAGGGINDSAIVNNTLVTEQAAILSFLQQLRASLPAAMIIVIGSEAGNKGPSAAIFNMELAAANAVTQFADANCFFVPQSSTTAARAWVSGTGTTGATNNSGNSDLYISADTTHPVQQGVLYFAQQSANGIIGVVNALLT